MPADYLHNHKQFPELIRIVSGQKCLDPALIEKDYWIMHSLYGLQKLGLIFELKGGTSLSKGFKIIDRFSEDIDSGRVSEVRQQFRVAGVFVPNFDSSYNVGPNAAHDMDLHPIVLLANRPVLMIKPAMETGGGEAGRVRRKINLNSLKR